MVRNKSTKQNIKSRKVSVLAFLCLMLLSPVVSTAFGLDLTSLAHYYPLDDAVDATSVADTASGGTNGTFSGTPTLGAGGVVNTAVYFSGNDRIDVTGGDYTAAQNTRTVMFFYNVDNGVDTQVLYEEGGGTNGYSIYVGGGDIHVGTWSEDGGYDGTFSATETTAGEWHHVALVYDFTGAGKAFFYHDGTLVTSYDVPVQTYAHSGPSALGAVSGNTEINNVDDSSSRYYAGYLDEVYVFSRALSGPEVNTYYLSNMVDDCPADENKVDPGICGCGVPDTDIDGDGTLDCNDACPRNPSKTTATGYGGCGYIYKSCAEILGGGSSVGNGVYWIDPDYDGTGFQVYCDMATDGGGWTMVAAQFEGNPATNWNEGIQGDYDPDLSTSKSFALNSTEIPSHTQMAVGNSLDPTFIDYFDYVYSTGNITKTQITGQKAGASYHIHRDTSFYYAGHDPERNTSSSAPWPNTLTIDETGGQAYTFAFAPNPGIANSRGYAMGGSKVDGSSQSYAWTIWVRTSDTDSDGTADSSDACPLDANKIAAGNCGCGVAEAADCNEIKSPTLGLPTLPEALSLSSAQSVTLVGGTCSHIGRDVVINVSDIVDTPPTSDVTQTVTCMIGGSWSTYAALDLSSLNPGALNFTVTHANEVLDPVTITSDPDPILDDVPPSVAITSAPGATLATKSDYSLSGTCSEDLAGSIHVAIFDPVFNTSNEHESASYDGSVWRVDTTDVSARIGSDIEVTTADCDGANWIATGMDLSNFLGNQILIAVDAFDVAGNSSDTATTETPMEDNAPPVVAISSPNAGMTVYDLTPTFSGTAEVGATVVVRSNIDGQVGSTTADGSGDWTLTASTMTETDHQITATATDAANNSATTGARALTLVTDVCASADINVEIAGISKASGTSYDFSSALVGESKTAVVRIENTTGTGEGTSPSTISLTSNPSVNDSNFSVGFPQGKILDVSLTNGCATKNGELKCWGSSSTGITSIPFSGGSNTGITSVSVSSAHACAIKDGSVYCWGEDAYGGVSAIPFSGSENSNITEVTVGAGHSCAIKDGSAYCWGSNSEGQATVPWSGAENSGVTSIRAASYHTCAIKDGGVYCWGRDDDGQVSNIPWSGADNTGVTYIDTDYYHACAVKNGSAYCWGETDYSKTTIPGSNSGITHVACGEDITCIIRDGAVSCWGNTFNGINNIPFSNSGMYAIAAGSANACAAKSDGTLKCWGNGSYDANNVPSSHSSGVQESLYTTSIASGYSTTVLLTVSPSSAGSKTGTLTLNYNDSHACTHTVDLTATGVYQPEISVIDGDEELSNGSKTFDFGLTSVGATSRSLYLDIRNDGNTDLNLTGSPTIAISGANADQFSVLVPPPSATIGAYSSASIELAFIPTSTGTKNATVTISSDDSDEGTFTFNLTGTANTSEIAVSVDSVDKASGGSFDFGTVFTGGSSSVQVTISNSGTAPLALDGSPPVAVDNSDFSIQYPFNSAIGVGRYHTCAIKNGAVSCWGRDYREALDVPTEANSGVVGITSGGYTTCAIKEDSSLYCWGDNFKSTDNPPWSGASNTGITYVDVGYYTACGIKDGGLSCWGDNSSGQRNVPGGFTSGVTGVAVAYDSACAIKDGAVTCWGSGDGAQNLPVEVSAGVDKVVAGYSFTCALKNGSVYCWGSDSYGQSTPPWTGAENTGITELYAGSSHACAVKNDELRCWGSNGDGQKNIPWTGFDNAGYDSVGTGVAADHMCVLKDSRLHCWGDNGYSKATVPAGFQSGVDIPGFSNIIDSGASSTFNLVYTPSGEGADSGTMSIASSDSDEDPFIVMLSALGALEEPEINVKQGENELLSGSGSQAFDATEVGSSSATIEFTIENIGYLDLNLTNTELTGTDAAHFEIVTPPTSPVTPSSFTTVSIRFAPYIYGPKTAQLSISSNDTTESTYTVELTGSATDSASPASPTITAPVDGATVATKTPTFSGTAEAYAGVEVFADATSIGTVAVDASGNWTLHPSILINSSLTPYSITAVTTDAAGNSSGPSAARALTIDADSDGDGNSDSTEDTNENGDFADDDDDGDTTPNYLDECDNDPDKVVPGVCGCGNTEDADGDSILDCEDATAPVVESVTTTTANGLYGTNDQIAIEINFDSTILTFNGGPPRLTLETGDTDAVVDCPALQTNGGKSKLTCFYTPAAGHVSGDLSYVSTSALAANGATIEDAGGNAAILTLPETNTSSSLGGGFAIELDGVIPTVTNLAYESNTGCEGSGVSISCGVGSTVTLAVSFDKAITIAGGATLNLSDGLSASCGDVLDSTTATCVLTVQHGEESDDLNFSSLSAIGTIKDAAGNDANLSLTAIDPDLAAQADIVIVTDTDNDNVPDNLDACPDDGNKGFSKGFCGCGVAEIDSDGDGRPDCAGVDDCPSDPHKTTPGKCGCGVGAVSGNTERPVAAPPGYAAVSSGSSTSGTELSIPIPQNTQVGDLLVAAVSENAVAGEVVSSVNYGWTKLIADSEGLVSGAIYSKYATKDEPSFIATLSAGAKAFGMVLRVQGVAPTNPLPVATLSKGVSENPESPAVNLAGDEMMALRVGMFARLDLLSGTTSGLNGVTDVLVGGINGDHSGPALGVSYLTQSEAGLLPTDYFSVGGPGAFVAFTIGISPARTVIGELDHDSDTIITCFEDRNSDGDFTNDDTDGDATPDFLDVDDDGDGVSTRFEFPDVNQDGNPNDARDFDGDAVPDYLDTDDDGDLVLTADETPDGNTIDGDPEDAQDTDGDGMPDYLDTDDDGDGILTKDEDLNNNGNPLDDDLDGDGIRNALDPDDDGDGLPTAEEENETPGTGYDACQDDANKTQPGLCGCGVQDVDTDGDGTLDCLEECPSSKLKTKIGQCGCDVSEKNSDWRWEKRLKIPYKADCIDACPNYGPKYEPGVCGCGVEDTLRNVSDIDKDGLAHCKDPCPSDPDPSKTKEECEEVRRMRGTLTQSSEPLVGVNVVLYNKSQDLVVGADYTDENGEYVVSFKYRAEGNETSLQRAGPTRGTVGAQDELEVKIDKDGVSLARQPLEVKDLLQMTEVSASEDEDSEVIEEIVDEDEVGDGESGDSSSDGGSSSSDAIAELTESILKDVIQEIDTGIETLKLDEQIYSLWNSYLDNRNVLELSNKFSQPVVADITVYAVSGQTRELKARGTRRITIPGNSQIDIILNNLAGFVDGSFGLVKVASNSNDLEGRVSYYRPSTTGGDFDYSFSIPLTNTVVGDSFVTFNAVHPGLGLGGDLPPVGNWLSIANVDSEEREFTVRYYDSYGEVIKIVELSIPPFARIDVDGGHNFMAPARAAWHQRIGLIEVDPNDDISPYVAAHGRFARNGDSVGLREGYAFAFTNFLRAGNSGVQYASVSNVSGTATYVEIANTRETEAELALTCFTHTGVKHASHVVKLPAYAQFHFPTSSCLPPESLGMIEIAPVGLGRVIAKSLTYYFSDALGIDAGLSSMAREPFARTIFGSYNSYLGQLNWLRLYNTTDELKPVSLIINPGMWNQTSHVLHLDAKERKDIYLNNADYGIVRDSYGVIEISFENSGTIGAELVRVKPDNNGGYEYLSTAPLR